MRMLFSNRKQSESGSVLMVSLLVAVLIGFVLSSYLLLIQAQNDATLRSQAWSAALTAAEAGVEEAFAKLNKTLVTTNLSLEDGWISQDDICQVEQRRVLDTRPFEVWYTVGYDTHQPLTIYATGYAAVPSIPATLTRTIKVETKIGPLFNTGLGLRNGIAMNGKVLTSDSYDSTSIYRSTDGKFDQAKTNGHGDLAISDSITNAARLDVYGKLFLGPATTNWFQSIATSGFNCDYPSVPNNLLSGQFAIPMPGTNGPRSYTYYLAGQFGQKYRLNGMTGSVYVARSAVLYVTGDANITTLDVARDATLTMYMAGGNTTLGEINLSGIPKNFQYYGLPGNTNISIIGIDTNIATIYAPDAVFRAGAKYADTTDQFFLDVDFIGALVVKSVNMKSDLRVHFDESLENAPSGGPGRGYLLKSWKEL